MKPILVAIDFSELSEEVLERATKLARAFAADLVLLHIVAPDPDFVGYEAGPDSVRETRALEIRSEHRRLQEMADKARTAGVKARVLMRPAATIDGIVAEAEKLEAQFIVMGRHAKGALSRVLLGSVTEGVLRQAPCPLVVVPDSSSDRT